MKLKYELGSEDFHHNVCEKLRELPEIVWQKPYMNPDDDMEVIRKGICTLCGAEETEYYRFCNTTGNFRRVADTIGNANVYQVYDEWAKDNGNVEERGSIVTKLTLKEMEDAKNKYLGTLKCAEETCEPDIDEFIEYIQTYFDADAERFYFADEEFFL